MSLDDCAALVQAGDPVRFAAAMAAPVAARAKLWPLYALNLEIARAPWASAEPMIAEMRLQWWIDTLDGLGQGQARNGHPVSAALLPHLSGRADLAGLLAGIAEERRWDCWKEPFTDDGAFEAYVDATSGNLMWAAARLLGADRTAEPAVRSFAWGAGLAAYLMAAPELERRGRIPFTDGRPEALASLADEGLHRMAEARKAAKTIPPEARPALWPGASAAAILRRAARAPALVAAEALAPSPFIRHWHLASRALLGRF
ncbi:squalene/phytoene synthase family protein [Frigidibacter sp. RF13]|uniref:squalene/phytoene synthase family protein n=1 Tax=Frigidibacter sp. RF13 TaxID=2997340 RepID=UPI00226E6AEA|nr:squalene/phytoene synthase family protein [Frigidibacter sp. RF13]MCY1125615.1 squalene/phytoene synthase family protein [Frigidibacter sp. RF13]